MASHFSCRAIFGLGITSLGDFIQTSNRYKAIRAIGIGYVTPSTYILPKTAILAFSSVKEVIRLHKDIASDAIVVVSDVPSLLKDIPDIVPLDYDSQRSFEFNFKGLDFSPLLAVMKAKKKNVLKVRLVSFDNLGYYTDKVKIAGEFINSYMSVTTSLPIEDRKKIRDTMTAFFTAKKVNTKPIIELIKKLNEKYTLIEAKSFATYIVKQGAAYHSAMNDSAAAAIAAKKHKVDPYAISYFRKIIRSDGISKARDKRFNVTKSKNP